MSKIDKYCENEPENETYPVELGYHPLHKIPRKIYDFFASAKLALALLVVILACCLTGVTVFRDADANEKIFDVLWFNGLLVLLVINVACCFFGRIWGRRVTMISFGMILFHLSFVAMFCGIIYNSLFHFRGELRGTEGEVLRNDERQSYDDVVRGRFFSLKQLKGTTTINKLLVGYKADGADKRVAYDVTVDSGSKRKQQILYLTRNLTMNGFTYLPDKAGFSLLTVLKDASGKEVYGAFYPLQSLKQTDKSFIYTTGTKMSAGTFVFPQSPEKPLFNMLYNYEPAFGNGVNGHVRYQVWPYSETAQQVEGEPLAAGRAAVGQFFKAGESKLAVKEVRYWMVLKVLYEPGKPIVMTSLWVAFAGIIITTVGRMLRSRNVVKS